MAENKKEGGSASFITQTEGYNVENDMDRHSRNMQLQPKGFREELHAPQASPYVHATERMNAIDTDTAAINTLGRGISAGIHIYDKFDKGPSIQQYLDQVDELKKAHEANIIDDKVYRREMRRARNAAENAYADDPRAMAKLKQFYGGGTFQDFALYEAAALDACKEYSMRTGEMVTPDDANFETVILPKVQEWRNNATQVALDLANYKQLIAKDGTSGIQIRDGAVKIADTASEFLFSHLKDRLASGNFSDNDIDNLSLQVQTWIKAYDDATGRWGTDDIVKFNRNRIASFGNALLSVKGMTDEAQRKKKIEQEIANYHLEGAKLDNAIKKGKTSTTALLNKVQDLVKLGLVSPEMATKLAAGIKGDPNAAAEAAKSAKEGEKGAGFISLALGAKNPEALQTAVMVGYSQNAIDEWGEHASDANKEELLVTTKKAFNEWRNRTLALGREEVDLNGKATPLSKQVRFTGFNDNGVRLELVKGAGPAAERYRRTVLGNLTNYSRIIAGCMNKKCDFQKMSKDKAIINGFKNVTKGIVDG